jgi:hypothetical protein
LDGGAHLDLNIALANSYTFEYSEYYLPALCTTSPETVINLFVVALLYTAFKSRLMTEYVAATMRKAIMSNVLLVGVPMVA